MQNIWISSDFHFGHRNIAGPKISRWSSGYRNFESVHEMNKTITENINKWVSKDDILYFLGDWCMGGHEKTGVYRDLINCKTIHFVRGNHDGKIDLYKNSFTSLNHKLEIQLGGFNFYMSHYPNDNWFGKDSGVIHLFGHCHNTYEAVGKSMDVGIDAAYARFGEYRPFSLKETLDLMR